MSNDTRQASGAHNRAKRQLTDADEDGRLMATDDSTAQTKRQRVSRACDSCRSKKDKCDGVQPVCSTCASLCRPCTYKTNPKKRGLPTGYIRTLELLYGVIFCKIQGSEEVIRTLLKASNMPSHLATMGKEAEGSDTLVSSWKNSIVLKEIERMLTFLDQPEEEQDKSGRAAGENGFSQEPEGSSSLHSLDTLEWQLPEGLADGQEGSIATGVSPAKTPSTTSALKSLLSRATKDSSSQTLSLPAITSAFASNQPSQPADPLPFPSNVWTLLDIYFSYTQCWFPILEKHDILRTAFRQSEDRMSSSPLVAGSGDYAALWAVLTLASMQEASLHASRQGADHATDRPNISRLYATAKGLIPPENGVHEIGHVQALLILSLVNLGQQKWTAAWLLVGQAIRIARCLGVDSGKHADGVRDGKSSARSKHVFLGCFVLETLVATKTGQAPSLRKEDLAAIAPVNEDGLEEWHPWEDQTGFRPPDSTRGSSNRGPLHALSTFNRLVSLMCILNEICCMRQSQTISTPQLEALERQLQHWISALPRSYRADLQNPTKIAAPHIFGLEIMYECTVNILSIAQDHGRLVPDTPYWIRAIDSLKALLLLVQKYMETYSLAATSPIFGMLLTLGISAMGDAMGGGQNVPASFEPELGLKSKLEAFSAHLSTVWSQGQTPEPTSTNASTSAATATRPSNASGDHTLSEGRAIISDSLSHRALHTLDSDAERMSGLDGSRTMYSTPDSFLTNSWMGAGPSLDNVALSLPTPSPSLSLPRSAPAPSPHITSVPASSHGARLSVPSAQNLINGRRSITDMPSPFGTHTSQYPQTFNDPNMNLGSFVNMDGHGSMRRSRIAPDLDALFDELASLDGTEQGDNQPEFMQNLGFIPDAGISELYSYSSQMEPFLLAQTQQLPETATGIRPDTHRTNEAHGHER